MQARGHICEFADQKCCVPSCESLLRLRIVQQLQANLHALYLTDILAELPKAFLPRDAEVKNSVLIMEGVSFFLILNAES